MRLDILDEYSTVIPFGMGLFEKNRVLQPPCSTSSEQKSSAELIPASRLRALVGLLLKL